MEPRIMIWIFESEKASTNYVLYKLHVIYKLCPLQIICHLQIAMNALKSLRCLVLQNNITLTVKEGLRCISNVWPCSTYIKNEWSDRM